MMGSKSTTLLALRVSRTAAADAARSASSFVSVRP